MKEKLFENLISSYREYSKVVASIAEPFVPSENEKFKQSFKDLCIAYIPLIDDNSECLISFHAIRSIVNDLNKLEIIFLDEPVTLNEAMLLMAVKSISRKG